MEEMDRHMTGQLLQFAGGDGDQTAGGVVLAEVVEVADGCVELAFDCPNPKRRTYIKVRLADLRRAIKAAQS